MPVPPRGPAPASRPARPPSRVGAEAQCRPRGCGRLPDVVEQRGEPRLGHVEGLAPGDPGEGDGLEPVAVLLVVTDHAGLPLEGALDSPMLGTHSWVSSHSRYLAAAAAVSHPQCRPITSCTMSIRGPDRCSPMMLRAKPAACSAAVQAPRDCLIGTTSLSIVLGSPTTVRW